MRQGDGGIVDAVGKGLFAYALRRTDMSFNGCCFPRLTS